MEDPKHFHQGTLFDSTEASPPVPAAQSPDQTTTHEESDSMTLSEFVASIPGAIKEMEAEIEALQREYDRRLEIADNHGGMFYPPYPEEIKLLERKIKHYKDFYELFKHVLNKPSSGE
jgi:hypothetical protein